jgi:hypothetical protein
MANIIKNTATYNKWEKRANEYAQKMADELIDDYNNGYVCMNFKTNQTKEVLTYQMQKVWLILHGSGIFMYHTIHKKKDKCEIYIELSDDVIPGDDTSDEEETKDKNE